MQIRARSDPTPAVRPAGHSQPVTSAKSPRELPKPLGAGLGTSRETLRRPPAVSGREAGRRLRINALPPTKPGTNPPADRTAPKPRAVGASARRMLTPPQGGMRLRSSEFAAAPRVLLLRAR